MACSQEMFVSMIRFIWVELTASPWLAFSFLLLNQCLDLTIGVQGSMSSNPPIARNCPSVACALVEWFPARRTLTEFVVPSFSSTHDAQKRQARGNSADFKVEPPSCRARQCQHICRFHIVLHSHMGLFGYFDLGHIFHSGPPWRNVATICD